MAASFGSFCSLGSHHFFLRPKLLQQQQQRQKRSSPVASAHRKDGGGDHGQHFSGRLVDQNMVTLRKRIHEIRMAENNNSEESEGEQEAAIASDWMEWERRYYAGSYASDVSKVIGMLQVLLLNVRPGVALTAMAALALSMPASMLVILFHLLQSH